MYTQEELKSHGLDRFDIFLAHVWAFLQLPRPTPVQIDIARYLQYGPQRVIVEAFRGVGKSWVTAAYVCWLLLNNPQLKVEVISASDSLAHDMTTFILQLIRGMPILHHLEPRGDQRGSTEKFDVGPAIQSKDPSVKSVGITGQITGTRADVVIADDVEVPKNSQTHLMREKLLRLVAEFDAILKPGGRIIYLGTPQVEDTLYLKLANKVGHDGNPLYTLRIWPAEIPAREGNYAGRLAPYVCQRIAAGWSPSTPIDPKRFSREDLADRRASYGASGYALQFMLDTNPSEADKRPLKLRDLIIHTVDAEMCHTRLVWGMDRETIINDLPSGGFDGDVYVRPAYKSPEMTKYGGTVLAIDPSGRGKDETAYAIVRYGHGLLYLVAAGGYLDGYSEETLESLARLSHQHGVNDVIVEENFGGGMFGQLLKPWLGRVGRGRVDDEYKGWSRTMKEERIIDTLLPVLRSHRLVVDRTVIEADRATQETTPAYSLVWQLTRMEKLRGALPHDDRVDALAMAVGYWTERMDRDNAKAEKDEKHKRKVEELKRFRKQAIRVVANRVGLV
jgi:hypothetical protein